MSTTDEKDYGEQKPSFSEKKNAGGDHTREIRFDTLAQGRDVIVHVLFRVPRILDFISISRFVRDLRKNSTYM